MAIHTNRTEWEFHDESERAPRFFKPSMNLTVNSLLNNSLHFCWAFPQGKTISTVKRYTHILREKNNIEDKLEANN